MDIRILRYFLTVAREENFSKAAEILHTTQPNISRQIADLEQEIGKPLLVRGKRKITLTEEGVFLRKHAQEIITLFEKTQHGLNSLNDSLEGDIYIGAGESYNMHYFGKAMKNLLKTYPQFNFHFNSGNAYDIADNLDKGLYDFAVLFEPVDLTKYDYLKLPMAETWGIYTRKDNPLSKLKHIKPKDLLNIPLLCSKQMLDENGLSGWLGQDCKNLNIVSTYNLINTPAMLAAEGIGNVISFAKLVNTSDDSPLCFIPFKPKLEASIYVVWKKYQIFSKPAELFLTTLQEVIAQEKKPTEK